MRGQIIILPLGMESRSQVEHILHRTAAIGYAAAQFRRNPEGREQPFQAEQVQIPEPQRPGIQYVPQSVIIVFEEGGRAVGGLQGPLEAAQPVSGPVYLQFRDGDSVVAAVAVHYGKAPVFPAPRTKYAAAVAPGLLLVILEGLQIYGRRNDPVPGQNHSFSYCRHIFQWRQKGRCKQYGHFYSRSSLPALAITFALMMPLLELRTKASISSFSSEGGKPASIFSQASETFIPL